MQCVPVRRRHSKRKKAKMKRNLGTEGTTLTALEHTVKGGVRAWCVWCVGKKWLAQGCTGSPFRCLLCLCARNPQRLRVSARFDTLGTVAVHWLARNAVHPPALRRRASIFARSSPPSLPPFPSTQPEQRLYILVLIMTSSTVSNGNLTGNASARLKDGSD